MIVGNTSPAPPHRTALPCGWRLHYGLAAAYFAYVPGLLWAGSVVDAVFHIIMGVAAVMIVGAYHLLKRRMFTAARWAYRTAQVGSLYGIIGGVWQGRAVPGLTVGVVMGLCGLFILASGLDDCADDYCSDCRQRVR